MKRILSITLLSISLLMTSCAQDKDYVVTIKTEYGDMVAILYNETPLHKANFLKLAKEHFYDSLLFHRVIDGFMIQGGDPDSKNAPAGKMLGQGGPGYTVPAEINAKYFHEKGALSAARLGDNMNPSKASSGSQFYIVQGGPVNTAQLKIDPIKFNEMMGTFFNNPANSTYRDSLMGFAQKNDREGYEKCLMDIKVIAEKETGIKAERDISPEKEKAYGSVGGTPQLDDQYTVFGKVIKGLDVIDKIAKVQKDRSDRPVKDVRMTVSVEEVSVSEIEKLYGYKVEPAPKK
ncbi:peptidylprolyl isomerase [Pseudochryseolinea flava]|uniref:Peptidyl-prolyl cis-trans isomerase n=1 Tax=Pseudochryseolinea flava TaxID=2059302 RepID=A0A364XW58_9BACT|nr:peptidylprolyl isomerase [Pseudochryseolinea flava]RAV98424.1 peptidylprolyl isomerase [Pseudochryseolinea flava]